MTATGRIVTVSLNPAIDQTAAVPNFAAGTVNRVTEEQSDAGGKGVNVASFLADFGHAVAATGFLGADNGELFDRLFAAKRIEDRFVRLPGKTRVNVKIVDGVRHQVTDINFPGLSAAPGDLAALTEAIDDLAGRFDWFVVSGSVPAGLPVTVYAELVAMLKRRGRTVVLDASGEPFARAIAAAPDLIKPNLDELRELTGGRLETEAEIVGAARDLLDAGIGLVAVSLGARGAIFVTKGGAVLAVPPEVAVRSTVGAGDAMVAGIVTARLRGLGLAECARLGTAFALGTLGEAGPLLPPPAAVEALAARVTVRDLVREPVPNRLGQAG